MLEGNQLTVFAEDESLLDNVYELSIKTSSLEEPSWYSSKDVKITYLQPACKVTQDEITSVG